MYRDNNQTINVKEVGSNRKLISYVIQDRMHNDIYIYNLFENDKYSKTEITLNGHKMFVRDISYVDNAMLRKPYTREDDLDFMMTNLFRQEDAPVKRQDEDSNVTNFKLNNCMQRPILPISIRKSQLLCSKTGF
jgi:hypothetical protein